MKITHYTIVKDNSPEKLAAAVQVLITQEWQPFGNLIQYKTERSNTISSHPWQYLQPMVKYGLL